MNKGGWWGHYLFVPVWLASACAGLTLSLPVRLLARESIILSPGRSEQVMLPPLAKVFQRERSENEWRCTGIVGGSLLVARGRFESVLSDQGWRPDAAIPLGSDAQRGALLLVMAHSGWTLDLLLWQSEPGTCRFTVATRRGPASRKHEPVLPKKTVLDLRVGRLLPGRLVGVVSRHEKP